ncbi:MAG: Na-K-Cl cotransporter [Nitrospinota bacterium]|nr:Na-K-Cl cotransporter [Nitrospinota bacterium]
MANANGTDKNNGNGSTAPGDTTEPKKFGTFLGVYIPSILTILGVIMYLRMGWVVGQVGLAATVLIVTLASLITFLTGLSISATATNMTVRTGGAYYMISRSFGVESGAALGIPLFLAQAISVSFYIAGFAESLHYLVPSLPIDLLGLGSLVLLATLAYFSAQMALKIQVIIFVVILASIGSLVLGEPLTLPAPASFLPTEASFWTVFALFFPAVTGILSGVSMSGDLKNPGRSIPVGTLSAVASGYIVYMMIPLFLSEYAPREWLLADSMVMTRIAAVPQLIFLGIWGATLSSALGSLLAAPRTLQALANDRVVPGFLGIGYGPLKEPRIATALTFAIAAWGVYVGTLDVIAPVLTMFFLTSYGILNFISGVETLIGNPSWRPRFKVHWLFSFAGALACFGVMMLIDAAAAYVAIIFCGFVYFVMKKRQMYARWSDVRRGIILHVIRAYLYKLSHLEETGRTWRPNLLVLSGAPTARWHLIELSDALSHGKGFLTVCSIVTSGKLTREKTLGIEKSMQDFLGKKGVPALTKVKNSESLIDGISHLIEDYGLGAISPNTLVFGGNADEEAFPNFCEVIRMTHNANKNLLIIRKPTSHHRSNKPVDFLEFNKVIDIWWGTNSNNAHFMLALSYLLQTSPEWYGARLRIRRLVDDENERQGVLANLRQLSELSRVQAEIEVFIKEENEPPLGLIGKYSDDADLVFLGLNPPENDQTLEAYNQYYQSQLGQITQFPMTVLTLAGEKIEFEKIFRE